MRKELEKKVQRAIRLLQSIPKDKEIELCYSGGKDSDVILELANMGGGRCKTNLQMHDNRPERNNISLQKQRR